VATTELAKSQGHPFYRKLNGLLAEAGFDAWVEEWCASYYAESLGRPSIPPGVYFRMIFVGYFEGIGSQRGIAWRCNDSLSLREFLGLAVTEASPDHSSLTRVHQRLPLEVHEQVFTFMLRIALEKRLLKGKTVGVDATTLEANAAMKSIVRKGTGEDWKEYLRRLAAQAGIANPSDEELRRFDRQRQDKKVSNDDWESPTDRTAASPR
jgi:transposase